LMREVVARAEKHHAPLAFVDAELERRQGEGADMVDERCFFLRADEVRLVVEPPGRALSSANMLSWEGKGRSAPSG
jgi:hypothetical protein